MKVRIYKGENGELSAFVEASPGKGRSPVLVKGLTPANAVDSLLPIITRMRGPKTAPAEA